MAFIRFLRYSESWARYSEMEMTWSHREWMWSMSDWEMSVPIEMTAAAFRVCSRSSGRIAAKSVEAPFVLKPEAAKMLTHSTMDLE